MYWEDICDGKCVISSCSLLAISHILFFFQIEAKIIMSRLFQQFIIQLPKDYELHIEQKITLEPKDGVNCTLKMRG